MYVTAFLSFPVTFESTQSVVVVCRNIRCLLSQANCILCLLVVQWKYHIVEGKKGDEM